MRVGKGGGERRNSSEWWQCELTAREKVRRERSEVDDVEEMEGKGSQILI